MHAVNEESSTQFSIFPLYFLEHNYIFKLQSFRFNFFVFIYTPTPFPEVKMWISNSFIVNKVYW